MLQPFGYCSIQLYNSLFTKVAESIKKRLRWQQLTMSDDVCVDLVFVAIVQPFVCIQLHQKCFTKEEAGIWSVYINIYIRDFNQDREVILTSHMFWCLCPPIRIYLNMKINHTLCLSDHGWYKMRWSKLARFETYQHAAAALSAPCQDPTEVLLTFCQRLITTGWTSLRATFPAKDALQHQQLKSALTAIFNNLDCLIYNSNHLLTSQQYTICYF